MQETVVLVPDLLYMVQINEMFVLKVEHVVQSVSSKCHGVYIRQYRTARINVFFEVKQQTNDFEYKL